MRLALALVAIGFASTAHAQDTDPPPPVSVSGGISVTSDYRLRGISQSDNDPAVQANLTIAHEAGFYIGAFASTVDGWGGRGGADVELDAIGGYRRNFGAATIDAGLTWYTYPGGGKDSDVIELFGKLSGTLGPATLTAGAAYAPRQDATSRYYRTAADYAAGVARGRKPDDNLYLSGDALAGIPTTPVSLRAHIGHSSGNAGLNRNGTSFAPTGNYWDWLLGADWTIYRHLTLGAVYVDTDIGRHESRYLAPNFRERDGDAIAGSTLLVSLSAAF